MTEMAQAGIAAGLDEICLTDHVDIVNWQAQQVLEHSWQAAAGQYAQACEQLGGRIKIQLGVELGQATEDFARADRMLMLHRLLTLSSVRCIIYLGCVGVKISAR